jgi:hypothetical protein
MKYKTKQAIFSFKLCLFRFIVKVIYYLLLKINCQQRQKMEISESLTQPRDVIQISQEFLYHNSSVLSLKRAVYGWNALDIKFLFLKIVFWVLSE